MRTLANAIKASPHRGAWVEHHGIVEVRCLAPRPQAVEASRARYAILFGGVPKIETSFHEVCAITSAWEPVAGHPLDWQPVYDPALIPTATTTDSTAARSVLQ